MTSAQQQSPWTRLETTLLALKAGEAIRVDDVASTTGLPRDLVRAVLDGLAKAALFEQPDGDAYVRRSLFHDLTGGSTVH